MSSLIFYQGKDFKVAMPWIIKQTRFIRIELPCDAFGFPPKSVHSGSIAWHRVMSLKLYLEFADRA